MMRLNNYRWHKWLWMTLTVTGSLCAGCGGPVWIFDPTFAEKLARQDNKPLLLYFKSWDSTAHRNMQTQVLCNPAVSRELKDTINAQLEFAFFQDWRNRYGVKVPQVCVMCSPDGKQVGSSIYVNPVPSPDKFAEWLRGAKAEARGHAQPPPAAAPSAKK